MLDKATTTIKIPKDMHHRIIIPKDIWGGLGLLPGDILQLDIIVRERANGAPEKEKE